MAAIGTFLERVRTETFSFVGLGLSIIALLMNTALKPVPMYVQYTAEIQSTQLNGVFLMVEVLLVALVILFLFFLYKKRK